MTTTLTTVELVGDSQAMARIHALVTRAAALDHSVLVVAERGAGVESVAREIHSRSRRARARFTLIDCGGDAAALDRRLFGAPVASADLEAVTLDSGVAASQGGTLCLHDVTNVPAAVQARLARLVRDGEMRVDGATTPIDFRLVATAPPGIDADVREHRFRSDLYRRLAATRLDLPPLRDRPDDIHLLASRILEDLCRAAGSPPRTFTRAALALLSAVNWPGNLDELTALVARVARASSAHAIQIEDVLPALKLDRHTTAFLPAGSLREARQRFERDYIAAVLQHHGWRVADAAQTLGMQRPNLYRKARQLGIPVTRLSE